MTTVQFLTSLQKQNIKVWADGEQLRFSAPQGAMTPELRSQLGARKTEILEFLKQARHQESASEIKPVPRDGELPLSFAQKRLWFLDQMATGLVAYNIHGAFRLTGPLNVEALKQAYYEILKRHESLRTTFSTVDGKPVQTISDKPHPDTSFPVVEMSKSSRDEREMKLRQIATEEAQTSFDLAQGPLIRAKLLRLDEREHVLLLTMHHIITDGWSFDIFCRELATLYDAFGKGRPSPLSPLAIQYADFGYWQQKGLGREVLQKQLDYWTTQLADPPVLELPTDRPRPPLQTFPGELATFELSPDLTKALKELCKQEGTTLFMTLLAAWKVLLYSYSGQEDLVVGSPIAGRNRAEIEALVGFFVNNLVLRTDLSGNPTFRELLAQVQKVALDAYAHQDLPFEKLVEELHPQRDMSRSPLFQVMFILQKQAQTLELSNLTFESINIHSGTAKFDMTLSMAEAETELVGGLEYNTDLFDASTISRMLSHFEMLLEGIVANPDARISDLPLLSKNEREQLLVDWNKTERDYPLERCYHELFAEQVERTPDAVAVEFEEVKLTYRDLDSRANQLAHHLHTQGVGPDALVGICVERSLEMLIGTLGVMKSGAGYVPLDPSYPPERLQYMLADSGAEVVLTQQSLLDDETVPTGDGVKAVSLDSEWETIAQSESTTPSVSVTSTNLAYVIYTSGSTGKPKGVAIPHRALVNFLLTMREKPGLTEKDTLLAVTTLSFDIAGLELYLPLLTGAKVVIASRDESSDGRRLAEKLSDCEATVMQATPATWRLLLESGWNGQSNLKVLCGGEALPRELGNRLVEKAGSVWNMYGPTETTIWSAVDKVEQGEGLVSIGGPIGNTQMYILDKAFRPVPVGVYGELYIGGSGLACGYLHRPELTAEKFIPDPFSETKAARLYRTGDLARYLKDGRIEFQGRIDHQVKVRGFRIELGEIESVLAQHSGVAKGVVVAREDTPGDQRLVAYVVAESNNKPAVDELRRFLQEQLPDYMVPSVFMFLEALPLTPNKKVDRKALPTPENERPELEADYVAPQNEVERTLAELWQEVLGVEKVGVNDNFFDLGGHSLLLVQIQSKLSEALGREVSIIDMFKYPTVSALARYFSAEDNGEEDLDRVRSQAERQKQAIARRKQRMKEVKKHGHIEYS